MGEFFYSLVLMNFSTNYDELQPITLPKVRHLGRTFGNLIGSHELLTNFDELSAM
jgi:hypothetical protein